MATQNRAELAYELREIALQDIELNPDNAIFRQLDTDEDVETLANDIDRNGLMHNLSYIRGRMANRRSTFCSPASAAIRH